MQRRGLGVLGTGQVGLQPYNFVLNNRIVRPNGCSTVPSILERGRLMGLLPRYTSSALQSSAAKCSKELEFYTRASLLGSSMFVTCCGWLLGNLATQLVFLGRMPPRVALSTRRAFECVTGTVARSSPVRCSASEACQRSSDL